MSKNLELSSIWNFTLKVKVKAEKAKLAASKEDPKKAKKKGKKKEKKENK